MLSFVLNLEIINQTTTTSIVLDAQNPSFQRPTSYFTQNPHTIMSFLSKIASLLSCCLPVPARQEAHHPAAEVEPAVSANSTRSPTPPLTPLEEIELSVLQPIPALPPRISLHLLKSNPARTSESFVSDIFADTSGLTGVERRELIKELQRL